VVVECFRNRDKKMAKTVMIWDACGQEEIQFYELEGDLFRLDGIYVNAMGPEGGSAKHTPEEYESLSRELSDLMYDAETGVDLQKPIPREAFSECIRRGYVLIVAGIVP
jgi:hypothetical protein